MEKLIFDTCALKEAFINATFRDKIQSLGRGVLLCAPPALEREFFSPKIQNKILEAIDEETYTCHKSLIFPRIQIQQQQKVKIHIKSTIKIFDKFNLPKQRGDIELTSFCIFHSPCIFITGDERLLNKAFVKYMAENYKVMIITSKQFVENY
jgi:predicted nucleic acid-binding protein